MRLIFLAGIMAITAIGVSACNKSGLFQRTDKSLTTERAQVALTAPPTIVGSLEQTSKKANTAPTPQLKRLNSSDMYHLLVGNTIKQVDDQYSTYFRNDGRLRALYANQTQSGTYLIDQNQVCMRWVEWNSAEPVCFSVYAGDQYYRFYDHKSKDGFFVNVRNGNSEQL